MAATTHTATSKPASSPMTDAPQAFRAMAETGDADDQFALAEEFVKRQNSPEAISWYKKAAAQGHPSAKRALDRLTKAN